jgi:hypothetical protein
MFAIGEQYTQVCLSKSQPNDVGETDGIYRDNLRQLTTATPHSVSEKENKVQRRMFAPKPLKELLRPILLKSYATPPRKAFTS